MEEGAWAAVVVDQQDSTLSLQFSTPANAPIGITASARSSTGHQGSSFMPAAQFTLLFSSWCPGELHCIHEQGWEDGQGWTHPWEPLGGRGWWAEGGAAETSRWTE